MQHQQLSPENQSLVSSTGEDKSTMSSPSSQYQKHSENPSSSSRTSSSRTSSSRTSSSPPSSSPHSSIQTSPGSSISQHEVSKMFDSTTIFTSESHRRIINRRIDDYYKPDRISRTLQNRKDQSLQMNRNNCSRTTQVVRATSSMATESEPTTLTARPSTILVHKSRQDESRYSSYPTVLPSIGVFDKPGAFIKNLLTLKGDRIFYALYFDSVHGQACIYKDETVEYTLLRSSGLLNHERGLAENQRDDRFRCLVYAPEPENDAERAPFHCYEDLQRYHANSHASDKLVLAKFVPLGCLQKGSLEAGKDQNSKHTTNYVLLWNTSTKPHSLWICYDYYTEDFEGYLRRCQLGKPTYYDEAYDAEYGPQTNEFDLEANLESDYESASQGLSKRDVLSGEYFRHDADDYKLLREPSPRTPLDSCHTTGEGRKANPGYFGTVSPFDLAVLASDINEWDGDTGLKRDSMYKCLETLRFRLGDTLRARAWVSTVPSEH